MAAEQHTNNSVATHALQQFAGYPFDSDDVYQQGLASILAGGALSGTSEQEKEDILRRSKVFYFNRLTGHSVTVEDTRLHDERVNVADRDRSDQMPSPTEAKPTTTRDANEPGETRTLTFADLKELIETGRTDQIPNNKVIPDALNDAPPSETTVPARKKPWELA